MEIDGAEKGPCRDPPGAPARSRAGGKPASFFLSKADECLSSFPPNFPLAIRFLEKGLSLHPNDVELLQRLAGEYAETGKIAEAKGMLQKAIEQDVRGRQPEACHSAFFLHPCVTFYSFLLPRICVFMCFSVLCIAMCSPFVAASPSGRCASLIHMHVCRYRDAYNK